MDFFVFRVVGRDDDDRHARRLTDAPQDLEAEQSVLGAMMLSTEATRVVIPVCKAEDFYREAHLSDPAS